MLPKWTEDTREPQSPLNPKIHNQCAPRLYNSNSLNVLQNWNNLLTHHFHKLKVGHEVRQLVQDLTTGI